jgi:hypothetical protein
MPAMTEYHEPIHDVMDRDEALGLMSVIYTQVTWAGRRWETDADGMRTALAAHDEVLAGRPRLWAACGFFDA